MTRRIAAEKATLYPLMRRPPIAAANGTGEFTQTNNRLGGGLVPSQ